MIVTLSEEEVTELLVATSKHRRHRQRPRPAAYGRGNHAGDLPRDRYRAPELARSTDWWMGPLVLVAIVFLVVGAYTIARGVLGLIF